jgi:hypothetical protein
VSYIEGSREARFGASTEQRVEMFLRERNLFVTRLCNIRNSDGIGAPMLMGAYCNLILPDLQVMDPRRLGQPYYVEVKAKTDKAWWGIGNCHTHGIDRKNWEQYRQVGLKTGLPVWLLILEDLSGELLGLRVSTCEPDHFSEPTRKAPSGMAYWRKSRLLLIAQLERGQAALDLPAPNKEAAD